MVSSPLSRRRRFSRRISLTRSLASLRSVKSATLGSYVVDLGLVGVMSIALLRSGDEMSYWMCISDESKVEGGIEEITEYMENSRKSVSRAHNVLSESLTELRMESYEEASK